MSALRVVLIASLVAAAMAVPLLAVPTTAIDVNPAPASTGSLQADANNSSEMAMGAQISGFMQQQTSQADGAIESGMWSAAYDEAGDESKKAALVDQRTEGLAAEVASLQAERRALIEDKQAGNITVLEFRSRMNGLAGKYASVMSALEETEPRAEAVGANVTTIQDLRGAATEAVGPSVAAAASSATVSPPGLANNTTVGPPVDVPGQDNGTEIGNGVVEDGPPGNGPPGNGTVGDGDGNIPGVGDDNSTEGDGTVGEGPGNGNGAGNGNGEGPGNGEGSGNGHSSDQRIPLAEAV